MIYIGSHHYFSLFSGALSKIKCHSVTEQPDTMSTLGIWFKMNEIAYIQENLVLFSTSSFTLLSVDI